MIPLDSPRWNSLKAPGCPIKDVVSALRKLTEVPDDPILDDLNPGLCVNHDIDTGSYAAVPHLVAIAKKLPCAKQVDLWLIVGSVASDGTDARGAQLPKDIWADYKAAATEAVPMVFECITSQKWRWGDAVTLLYAYAALRGSSLEAEFLVDNLLQEEEDSQGSISACLACKEQIVIYAKGGSFYSQVGSLTPGDPKAKHSQLTPFPVPDKPLVLDQFTPDTVRSWLPQLASQTGNEGLARAIRGFMGSVKCPACGHQFDVLDTFEPE